ncbi:MAG: MaoC family dehydratase [Rhizobiaceae bacterium]
MSLDAFFGLGETVTLGSHTFGPDEIKEFARKYDPQPFHVDEAAAERSVFARLCASGWHTAAMWMRYNLKRREDVGGRPWHGPGPRPEFGPSPGFTDLKWMKPVYAGDTITFTRTALHHRTMSSRPGWRLLTIRCEAHNQHGAPVLTFDSAVLVKAG